MLVRVPSVFSRERGISSGFALGSKEKEEIGRGVRRGLEEG